MSIDLASNVIFLAVGEGTAGNGIQRRVESGFKSFWNQVSSEIPVGEIIFLCFFFGCVLRGWQAFTTAGAIRGQNLGVVPGARHRGKGETFNDRIS